MIGEPAPTQADLHFRAFGVPVRIHPWFWIVSLFLGLPIGNAERAEPMRVVLWVAVVFVSILVHELGHAFLQRRFGGHPRITLYGFGGLASCNDCDRSPRSQILISLAGPMAGFLFALAIVLLIRLCRHPIGLLLPSQEINFDQLGVDEVKVQSLVLAKAYFAPFANPNMNYLIADLLQVNILWGFLNLLPIYPLDGGRVAREVLTLDDPRRGIVQSLWLSVIAAAALAAWALTRNSMYMAFMFGYLSYASYQTLQAYQGRRM